MKKYTVNEIAQYLIDNQSAEVEGNDLAYYAHIDENGNLIPTYHEAEETFKVYREVADGWNLQDEYETEDLNNENFRAVAEELTRQINDWIEEEMR